MRRQPGMGSIFRRKSDGRWVAQVSIGPRSQRSFVTMSAPTRAEARALIPDLLRAGAGGARTTDTVGAYLERWVREARDIRDTTRRGYRAVVTEHLVPMLGHRRLAALSPADVEAALTALAPRMSPKSLRNVHAVLRRALGQAVRTQLVPRNVAAREFIDTPRVPELEPRALSEEEVDRLLLATRGDRLEALIVTAVGTGLRQGELLGLAWEDLDLDLDVRPADDARGGSGGPRQADGAALYGHRLRAPDTAAARHSRAVSRDVSARAEDRRTLHRGGAVHVRRELIRINPGQQPARYDRGPLKTTRSRRDVPLVPSVVAALEHHRERMKEEGFVPVPGGPVFVNGQGTALNGSWVTHHFYRLLERAGVPRVPFKQLRTTFASRLADAGVSDVTIADLLGHSRTSTTRKHYISSSPERAREAVARLERRVG